MNRLRIPFYLMSPSKFFFAFIFVLQSTIINHQVLSQETITFKADDGVDITADLYLSHNESSPFIILFHQAQWSRGEYREIAPKLNKMGFNCMAVDQRAGKATNGIVNQTHLSAKALNKSTGFPDAEPDMIRSIQFVRKNHATGKIIIWGSSYSSSLVLKIAGDRPELIDAALSFAPGEYFSRFGKGKDYISKSAKKIEKPVFITSAKDEKDLWWGIYTSIPSSSKSYYLPTVGGNHGSKALWEKFEDNKGYWAAVETFLNNHK